MKVIDISKYNTVHSFEKVKAAGVAGVIIRAGSGRKGLDPKFRTHIECALAAGLPVGIYFFSYAYNVNMAIMEARMCLEYIEPYRDQITLPVYFDWEYDSMNFAKSCGVNPTGKLITEMCDAFLSVITNSGYRGGVYYNKDYVDSGYIKLDSLKGYSRWYARYASSSSAKCDLWQYTSKGTVDGVAGTCDISKVINKEVFGNTAVYDGKSAADFVGQAKKWLGLKKSDRSYVVILNTYNGHKPLARGYTVQISDQWCATFVSACAIASGCADIVPLECSCERMINLFKGMGCWVEDDAYVPSPGCVIFYDWDDSGAGDDTGWADHVGIVEKCDGKTITVIEGNKGGAVARRTIKVNAKCIRGYGVPKFAKGTDAVDEKTETADGKKTDSKTTTEGKKSDSKKVDILGGVKMPELKKGSSGKTVKVWQAIVGTSIDGKFGAQTEKKTKAFQKEHKLAQDGVVGPKTWKAGLESLG